MVCEWIDAKRPWSACSEFHELPPFAVVLCERLLGNGMVRFEKIVAKPLSKSILWRTGMVC